MLFLFPKDDLSVNLFLCPFNLLSVLSVVGLRLPFRLFLLEAVAFCPLLALLCIFLFDLLISLFEEAGERNFLFLGLLKPGSNLFLHLFSCFWPLFNFISFYARFYWMYWLLKSTRKWTNIALIYS